MPTRLVRPVAVTLAFLAACGGRSDEESGGTPLQPGWNPVQGMVCADGSPTGIGVSAGAANRVLVVLSGGGACWSEASCDPSTPRSFGAGDFGIVSLFTASTIFDRALPGTPFADWTMVFVPYCTGDVHAGADVTRTYGARGTWRHHGRANLDAALSRIASAMPSAEKVVVSGSSAGGFGSLLAYDLARARWPAASKIYLVDDSGPTFVGSDLPQAIRDAWWTSWNLDASVTPLCPGCRADLSELWTALHAAHPADRLSLLTSTQDATMIGFFAVTAPQFETGVTNLALRLAGIPNAKTFVVGDLARRTGHAFLLAPGLYAAGGRTLPAWLSLQVNDDPAWTSVGP